MARSFLVRSWSTHAARTLELKARKRKRERVRCSSLVNWPVYPCLRRIMQGSEWARNSRPTPRGADHGQLVQRDRDQQGQYSIRRHASLTLPWPQARHRLARLLGEVLINSVFFESLLYWRVLFFPPITPLLISCPLVPLASLSSFRISSISSPNLRADWLKTFTVRPDRRRRRSAVRESCAAREPSRAARRRSPPDPPWLDAATPLRCGPWPPTRRRA
jgi:hypothetical protein